MTRIVYITFPAGDIRGGQKMIVRHVETLRELGFEATCWISENATAPSWFGHRAPIAINEPFRDDDILVLPDDAQTAIARAKHVRQRLVIFAQNQFSLGIFGLPGLEGFPVERLPAFMVVGRSVAQLVERIYPNACIETVRCFADERVFRPGAVRDGGIAYVPRKRNSEAAFIREVFPKLYPRHGDRPWRPIENMAETEVARTFAGSELFQSLSRLESVGMTPLEAMASGCVCAGFTGIGGQEYATAENGFWAPEDDCVAAVDALGAAADLAATGGPGLRRLLEAGRETARDWSYAGFRVALEATWMRLAPEARVRDGPLDHGTELMAGSADALSALEP